MGDALAWLGLNDTKRRPLKPEKPRVPVGSLAWRREMRQQKERQSNRELLHSEGWG